MKKLIFIASFTIGAISLYGMETDPEIQKQEQGEVNQIINEITEKISWLFGPKEIELEELPEEILANIILQMPGSNFTETIEAIKALSQTNITFNRLINDPKIFETLLNAMGKKYNIDPFLVAPAFGSKVAKEWFEEISFTKETLVIIEKSIDRSTIDLEDYFGIIRGLVKWRELFGTKRVSEILKAALYKKCHEHINNQLNIILGPIREKGEKLQPSWWPPRFSRRIDIDYDI